MSDLNNAQTTQVVIAGAGPTGLSMAAQCIRHKVDFIILEKNSKTTMLSKALVVQARTMEIFQELGIAERATAKGAITTGLRLFYKGRQRAAIDINGLGNGLSPFPFALSLEQSKTENLLADFLAEHGKTIKWNSELTQLEQNGKGVTIYYKGDDGQERKITAAYLVGCDGAGSPVRHQLGLPFEGSTEPRLFYVADVVLKSSVICSNELYMYMIKKGFVLFFPMEGAGHYRIVGVLPEVKDMDQHFEFADIDQDIRKQIISDVEFKELRWFSTYKVHSRKASAFRAGHVFLAGDAAHIHTPAGGQGMNTGIQDAYNLAWKIAFSLRGETNDHVLESYNTERTANARHLLESTDRMFDIMSGVNSFWNMMRLTFFPTILGLATKSEFVRKRIFPLISQTGISYPDSYLTSAGSIGKVKAGDRMHYFVFSNGRDIFSYLSEPVFKLLYFGDEHINPFQRFDGPRLKMIKRTFGEIPEKLFGKAKDFYILLRPDNHVSYIGKDAEECKRFIQKIIS